MLLTKLNFVYFQLKGVLFEERKQASLIRINSL